MTTDRYTKAVLTVIAACLLWQCALAAGRTVQAQTSQPALKSITDAAKPVVIVGWGEMNEDGQVVRIFTTRTPRGVLTDPTAPVRLPYSADAPLPVSVNGAVEVASSPTRPLSVAVTQIHNAGTAWDPIATKVEPAGTRKTPGEIR